MNSSVFILKACFISVFTLGHESDLKSIIFSLQEEMKKEMYETILPTQLVFFEKLLKGNNYGKGYFVGDKVRK